VTSTVFHGGAGAEAIRGDDRVTEQVPRSACHEHLTRGDGDAELDALGVRNELAAGEGRADGALGVVLVRDWSAEDGSEACAEQRLHGAAEALELGADAGEARL